MIPVLLATLACGCVALALGARIGRWAFALLGAPLAAALAVMAAVAPASGERTERVEWVDGLGLAFSLRLDAFAVLGGVIVAGIGVAIAWYSAWYFGERSDIGRIAGLLTLFGGAMLGLVWADDVLTVFVFWELTSVTSFLLIGIDDRSSTARQAATRALLVTGGGGLAMLGGLVLLAVEAGSASISAIVSDPPDGTVATVGAALVLAGAFTKSAQAPFHFWLPGAMAAPTPVSAYLHSATMVKAGIVLVARLAPGLAPLGPWRGLIAAAGVTSLLLGGLRAMRQYDAKLLLAHGTVSQLGFLMVLVGAGDPGLTAAGVAMLLTHALFKAALFLVVGIVDHSAHSRDLRALTGLGRRLPLLAALAGLAAASMAGIPPLLGFAAKEMALDEVLHADLGAYDAVVLAGIVLGSVLTAAYSARLVLGLFGSRPVPAPSGARTTEVLAIDPDDVGRPSPAFVAPVVVLVAASLLGGLLAPTVGDWLAPAASSLDPDAGEGHLVLWAGVHAPLLISAGILAVAAVLVALRWVPGRVRFVPAAQKTYDVIYDGLLTGAQRATAVVQSGSLPVYTALIFLVFVALASGPLVAGAWPASLDVSYGESAWQVGVAGLASVLAIGVLAARRRFVAALLLGGVGYSIAVIFLIHGAPDLALTQFLVETVTIVVFFLVLRRLPDRFGPGLSISGPVRIALATAVGSLGALWALVAAHSRVRSTASGEMVRLAEPEGGGRNVVNVILVDFRAMDTLVEITVLALASAGVANLVLSARMAARRGPAEVREAALREQPQAGSSSPVLLMTSRLLVPVLVAVSLYLTFRGHNAPGGGFAGGLVAGAAIVLRWLAEPVGVARALGRMAPVLVGGGLLVALGTGAGGLVLGDAFLQSGIRVVDLPVVGELKLVSSTVFDLGVMALVVGVILAILTTLGAGRSRVVIQVQTRTRRPAGGSRAVTGRRSLGPPGEAAS